MTIPALPTITTTSRYVTATLTAQTTVNVTFPIFGDGDDLLVLLDGVKQTSGWELKSSSGTLATVRRPFTDGYVEFAAAKTGVVEVFGRFRPRRLTNLSESAGPTTRDFNYEALLDKSITSELFERMGRTIELPYGTTGLQLLSAEDLAGKIIAFDDDGNMVLATRNGEVSDGEIGTAQLADGAVTNAKLADMPEATFKMRAEGEGTGVPINGTAAQARAAMDVPHLSGENTFSGANTFSIGLIPTRSIDLGSAYDLDTATVAGWYDVDGPTNGPFSSMGNCHIRVTRHGGSANAVTQELWQIGRVYTSIWSRARLSGTWQSWRPVSGFAFPSHFGADPATSPSGATTNQDTAIQNWLNSGHPLAVDGIYRIGSGLSRAIGSQNGFSIHGAGPCASLYGFRMAGTSAQLEISGADYDNPHGYNVDQYALHNLCFYIDSATSSDILRMTAADGDKGSGQPGLDMRNVHFIPSSTTEGSSSSTIYTKNIRQAEINNVTGKGVYNAHTGTFWYFDAGDNGCPVEVRWANCRAEHFNKMFDIRPASGSTADDDAQGLHFVHCTSVITNNFIWAETGSEAWSEWMTVYGCHANFRDTAIYAPNWRRVGIDSNYFLGYDNSNPTSTITAVALGLDVGALRGYSNVVNNKFNFDATSRTNRKAIVSAQSGSALSTVYIDGNISTGATTAYTYTASDTFGTNLSY